MGTLSGKGGEVSVATMVIPEKQQGYVTNYVLQIKALYNA